MKKRMVTLLALVACVTMAFGVLSACGHEHTMEYHPAVEATCTEGGMGAYYSCTECGLIFSDEAGTDEISLPETAPLGHSYGEWEVVVSATCTEDGLQKQTCTRCGNVAEQPMKAPGHNYSDWTEVYPPTCTETGLEKRTCLRGDDEEERDIKALGHNFVNMTCTRCGASQMSDKLEFTRNSDGSYTVTGIGKETGTEIYIPNSYQGSPVTAIGERAFAGNDEITGIYFNGGVETIGKGAFGSCHNLCEVRLSDSIKEIGKFAFFNTALTEASLPTSVIKIGDEAFGACYDLISFSTPRTNTVYETIDGHLYSKDGKTLVQYAIGNPNESFSIPDSVEKVEARAFSQSIKLKAISVPASVKELGEGVFRAIPNLEEINVDDGNIVYRSRSGNLYTADGTTLLQYAAGKNDRTFVLPDDVKLIADMAFSGASALQEVSLSVSLTEIGEGAFARCTSLVKVDLPASLEIIHGQVFLECTALKEIMIPASVKSIGVDAFKGCNALKSAVFAETSGWSVGGTSLSAESLSNPETAATYLKNVELAGEWTRK